MGYPPGSVLELLFGDKARHRRRGPASHGGRRSGRRPTPPTTARTTGTGWRSAASTWPSGSTGLSRAGARGARPAARHGRVPGVHGRDAGRASTGRSCTGSGACSDERAPARAAHQQRGGVGRPLARDVPGRRAVRDRRRLERRSGMRKPDPPHLPAHLRARRRRPRRRRCSSTTTPTTSRPRARSAWRPCTSARTRSWRSPSSTRSSTAAGVKPR